MLDTEEVSKFVRTHKAPATAPYERRITSRKAVDPVRDGEVAVRLGVVDLGGHV